MCGGGGPEQASAVDSSGIAMSCLLAAWLAPRQRLRGACRTRSGRRPQGDGESWRVTAAFPCTGRSACSHPLHSPCPTRQPCSPPPPLPLLPPCLRPAGPPPHLRQARQLLQGRGEEGQGALLLEPSCKGNVSGLLAELGVAIPAAGNKKERYGVGGTKCRALFAEGESLVLLFLTRTGEIATCSLPAFSCGLLKTSPPAHLLKRRCAMRITHFS